MDEGTSLGMHNLGDLPSQNVEVTILNIRPQDSPAIPSLFAPRTILTARASILITYEGRTPVSRYFVARLVAKDGTSIASSDPITVKIQASNNDDKEALEAISKGGLWPFVGPHPGRIDKSRLILLRDLAKKHGNTSIGLALQCGVAFADDSDVSLDDRIVQLRAFSRNDTCGWTPDCLLEMHKLLTEAGHTKEAQEVAAELAAYGSIYAIPAKPK